MSKLVIQPSFRAVGQIHVERQIFEKTQNKREMYGSQADYHTFVSYFRVFQMYYAIHFGTVICVEVTCFAHA